MPLLRVALESRSRLACSLSFSAAFMELLSASKQNFNPSSRVRRSPDLPRHTSLVEQKGGGGFCAHLGLPLPARERGLPVLRPSMLSVSCHLLPKPALSPTSSAHTLQATASASPHQALPRRPSRHSDARLVMTRYSFVKMRGCLASPRPYSTSSAHRGKLDLLFPTVSSLEIRGRQNEDMPSFLSWTEGRRGRDLKESTSKSMTASENESKGAGAENFGPVSPKRSYCQSWEDRRLAQAIEASQIRGHRKRFVDRRRPIGALVLSPPLKPIADEPIQEKELPSRQKEEPSTEGKHLIAHRNPSEQGNIHCSTHNAEKVSNMRSVSAFAPPGEVRKSGRDSSREDELLRKSFPASHSAVSPTPSVVFSLARPGQHVFKTTSVAKSGEVPSAETHGTAHQAPSYGPSILTNNGAQAHQGQPMSANVNANVSLRRTPLACSVDFESGPTGSLKLTPQTPGTSSRTDTFEHPWQHRDAGRQLIFGAAASHPVFRSSHPVGLQIFREPSPSSQSFPAEMAPPVGLELPPSRILRSAATKPENLRTSWPPPLPSLSSNGKRVLSPVENSSQLSMQGALAAMPHAPSAMEELTRSSRDEGTDLSMEQRSPQWYALRSSRLTASAFSKALGFWSGNRVELWEEKIGLRERFKGNSATAWGQRMEPVAVQEYERISGNVVTPFPFKIYGGDSGDHSRGWLGASPDGLLELDGLGGNSTPGILEVKCPFNRGMPTEAQPHPQIPVYYIPQVQGLLEIFDRDWLDFYSWTMRSSIVFRIQRDPVLWSLMHGAMEEFWFRHVIPAKDALKPLGIRPEEEAEDTVPANSGSGSVKEPPRGLGSGQEGMPPDDTQTVDSFSSEQHAAQGISQCSSPGDETLLLATSPASGSAPDVSASSLTDPEVLEEAWRAVEPFRPSDEHYLTGHIRTLCQKFAISCRVLKYASIHAEL